jgi:hypothetical protein
MRDLRSQTRFLLKIVALEPEFYANHPISGLLVSPVDILRARINRQLIPLLQKYAERSMRV